MFFFYNLKAQKENYNWYFGQRAGITFKTIPPSAVSKSSINTEEGCSSISDSAGNLLFYTDGVFVYNRKHKLMGCCLGGHYSSTQSALILKRPLSKDLYYIFTVGAEGGSLGYGSVDMKLDSGYGGLDLNSFKQLETPDDEKIIVVANRNGTDYWLITHTASNFGYSVYRIDASGVHLETRTSTGNKMAVHGYLKASPSGKLLAICDEGTTDILSFNNETGDINFLFNIPEYGVYGLEFSPNDSFLYAADRHKGNLYQYNIYKKESKTIDNTDLGALQLGPDGKIYVGQYNTNYLGVINYPNLVFPYCDSKKTRSA